MNAFENGHPQLPPMQMPMIPKPIKRTIYSAYVGMNVDKGESLPDITIPDPDAVVLTVVVDPSEVICFVLPENVKRQLVELLTGGIVMPT